MGFKSSLIRPWASAIARKIKRDSEKAVHLQQKWLLQLIQKGRGTKFGRDHDFDAIRDGKSFAEHVPIRNYEALKIYIDDILDGQGDVLWPGKPSYLAKTSGTTSGVKYIPISKESLPYHMGTARNALFNHFHQLKKSNSFDGKMIFLSGSPELETQAGIPVGRLSGIVNHHIPKWLQKNRLPSYETNCIDDWETKVQKVVEETAGQPMSVIGGIPPWIQMYYEKLLEYTGKETVRDVFPSYEIFVFGGVNFNPYKSTLEKLAGPGVSHLETYPASEGFIAFQDQLDSEDLLLNINAGMYFEFVKVDDFEQSDPPRYHLGEVETNQNYVLIINSNAGLWGYNTGDTIEFVSLHPPRIRVTGRIKHFISAFGEHVIAKEVESAMARAIQAFDLQISEFTVAPHVNPEKAPLPHHEWYVEFSQSPVNLMEIAQFLDKEMRTQNIYYDDLIEGGVLMPLVVHLLEHNAFRNYMEQIGKLGGQNKVPRLSNDRKIADALRNYIHFSSQ